MRFLIINGPNINMLGLRQPEIYGTETYNDLVNFVTTVCEENDIEVEFFQSNHEGAIVDRIQLAYGKFDGIIINPAAYTHTSIALLDALNTVSIPAAEVHISDITAREDFRQISFVGLACQVHVIGLGIDGYAEAILQLRDYILDPPQADPNEEIYEEEFIEDDSFEDFEEELMEDNLESEEFFEEEALEEGAIVEALEEVLDEILEEELEEEVLEETFEEEMLKD